MMRTPKRAPSSSSSGYGSTPPAKPDATDPTNAVLAARPSVPPPPPNGETRKLKRMPLRRMPTELVMTTRMLPVRMGTEHGSAVRPVERVTQSSLEFDRRPTAPCLPNRETEACRAAAVSGETDAYASAQILVRSAPRAPHGTPVAEAPRQRAMAAAVTQAADYSVPSTPSAADAIHPSDAYDNIPELASCDVMEENAAVIGRAARAAAMSGEDSHAAEAYEELTQARRQLALAVETARKSEQRAREAELIAAWAERYVPELQRSAQHSVQTQPDQRMRWLLRALQISLVGLAVGGYVSLLGPVRERVVTQNATIQRLTELQEQLRSEQRELRERVEQERGAQLEKAEKAPPAHETRATRGKAVAPR